MPETTRDPLEATTELPHRQVLEQILDKWSLRVLAELCEQPLRFNALRRAIPGITQKSLTSTLRRLERNGVVQRAVIGTRPIAIEYAVAPLGKTLRGPIDALERWAAENCAAVEDARDRFDDLEAGEAEAAAGPRRVRS
jgi:DNA-binding HxlR family transcriptional regulator